MEQRHALIDALERALAHNYALALKTQNYHWNVTGQQFITLHAYFEELYTDLSTANDQLAERIIMLGDKVKATFLHFHEKSQFSLPCETFSSSEMLHDLLKDHQIMIQVLQETLKTAQQVGCEVTVDLMIQRLTVHEKTIWFMKSLLVS